MQARWSGQVIKIPPHTSPCWKNFTSKKWGEHNTTPFLLSNVNVFHFTTFTKTHRGTTLPLNIFDIHLTFTTPLLQTNRSHLNIYQKMDRITEHLNIKFRKHSKCTNLEQLKWAAGLRYPEPESDLGTGFVRFCSSECWTGPGFSSAWAPSGSPGLAWLGWYWIWSGPSRESCVHVSDFGKLVVWLFLGLISLIVCVPTSKNKSLQN